MEQRDGIAVRRPRIVMHRARQPPAKDTTPARRRAHVGPPARRDVDTTVLAACRGRPRRTNGRSTAPPRATSKPRARPATSAQQSRGRSRDRASLLSFGQREGKVASRSAVVKYGYNERGRAGSGQPGQPRHDVGRPPPRSPRPTSSATAASAPPRRRPRAHLGRRPRTSVISPFGGSANRAATSAAEPRTTSSKRFVSSRHTATGRSGIASASDASVPAAAAATRTPRPDGASARAPPRAARAFSPRGR